MQEIDTQTSEWLEKIGLQIRQLRKERANIGYALFAKKVGMSKNTILKVEMGQQEYYLSTLMRILSYYPDVSMEQFFQDLEL